MRRISGAEAKSGHPYSGMEDGAVYCIRRCDGIRAQEPGIAEDQMELGTIARLIIQGA